METVDTHIKKIINDIYKKLMIARDHCNILCCRRGEHREVQYSTLNADFYNGLSGLSYVLINYYSHTRDGMAPGIVDKLINTCQYYYKENSLDGKIGFYEGIAGYYFLLLYAGDRLSNPGYIKNAEAIRSDLIKSLRSDKDAVDVISGVAGILLNFSSPSFPILDDELRSICAETLLETYQVLSPDTICWERKKDKKSLGGLSHGTAGIALALFRLYELTHSSQFLELGLKSLQHDALFFDKDKLDWWDNRYENKVYSNAWCHGSPSLILPFLKARQLTNEPSYTTYLDIAIENTLTKLTNTWSWSLCHGLLGNAEILQYAALHHPQKRQEIEEKLGSLEADLLNKLEEKSNGLGNKEFHAGFMQGTSGVCHYLLKGTGHFYSPIIFE
jgi:lantibiotic modifying enzyme